MPSISRVQSAMTGQVVCCGVCCGMCVLWCVCVCVLATRKKVISELSEHLTHPNRTYEFYWSDTSNDISILNVGMTICPLKISSTLVVN